MHLDSQHTQDILKTKGLKVTPQRTSVLEAIYSLHNHPTAEQVTEFVRKKHPSISTGTVYKTLDTFVKHGVIRKVRTENEVMRYDSLLEKHHHLFLDNGDKIVDYVDEELDSILKAYFDTKKIEGYQIDSITLHINGKLMNNNL